MRAEIFENATKNIETLETETVELFDLVSASSALTENIAAIEADIYSDVCAEVAANDKPKFSNDGARKAESQARASKNESLQVLREASRGEQRAIAVKRARIEMLNSSVSLAKAFLHGSDGGVVGLDWAKKQ